jgi:hypothetical protein
MRAGRPAAPVRPRKNRHAYRSARARSVASEIPRPEPEDAQAPESPLPTPRKTARLMPASSPQAAATLHHHHSRRWHAPCHQAHALPCATRSSRNTRPFLMLATPVACQRASHSASMTSLRSRGKMTASVSVVNKTHDKAPLIHSRNLISKKSCLNHAMNRLEPFTAAPESVRHQITLRPRSRGMRMRIRMAENWD